MDDIPLDFQLSQILITQLPPFNGAVYSKRRKKAKNYHKNGWYPSRFSNFNYPTSAIRRGSLFKEAKEKQKFLPLITKMDDIPLDFQSSQILIT